VADEQEALVPEVLDEGAQILDGGPDPVAVNALGLGGEVVAPLVGSDGEVVGAELPQLAAEGVVELGEPCRKTTSGPAPAWA
jgi:hypothetical protein